jgi:hypothetical protein
MSDWRRYIRSRNAWTVIGVWPDAIPVVHEPQAQITFDVVDLSALAGLTCTKEPQELQTMLGACNSKPMTRESRHEEI